MDCMTMCSSNGGSFQGNKIGKQERRDHAKKQRWRSSTWNNNRRLPKIRIEECGLTVELKNYNQHYKGKGRSKSLPDSHLGNVDEDLEPDNDAAKIGLMGANFCKCEDNFPYDERFIHINACTRNKTRQLPAILPGMEQGTSTDGGYVRYEHPVVLPGFEQSTSMDNVGHFQYEHRESHNSKYKDKTEQYHRERSRTRQDVKQAQEKVVIRRLASKRSKNNSNTPPRVSTSYAVRPTRSTDIWVSNPDGDPDIQTHPMPDFLRQIYESRDAFIETLRSRSGADKISANVRLAQEFTRDRYGRNFDSGLLRKNEQKQQQHNFDCPLCQNYVPTYYGHVCQPNTPFNKDRSRLRSRGNASGQNNNISDAIEEKTPALPQRSNKLASLFVQSL